MKNTKHGRMPFLYILGLGVFLATNSCRKSEPGFDMTYRRTFELPIGLNTFQSWNRLFTDIATDTSVFFPANQVTGDKVTAILPKGMRSRSAVNQSFEFVSRIEVYISDPSRPQLTEQTVFFRDDVPFSSSNRIDLIPNNIDVSKFIKGGSRYQLRINFRFRDISQRSIDCEWEALFFARTQ